MNLYDVLHAIVDRTNFHDAAQAALMQDAVTAHEAGFASAEEYRKSSGPVATQADVDTAQARLDELKAQREAQATATKQQQAVIAASPPPPAPVAPAPVADPVAS